MNNQAAQTPTPAERGLPELLRRAIPFLRDEAANYVDDGSNEPLELVREIESALAGNPNRDAANPGGCECEKCGRVFIGAEWHVLCGICIDHGVAQPDGSGLRNGKTVPASTPEASPQPQVANPACTATLPELPDQDVDTERGDYYSMDAMEAYGRACYEAGLSARPLPSDWVEVPEPNGKLVGWWNGIMPDVTERSPYGPSVRWGADAEDRAHDIPLYDGYNPIHYRQPDALAAAPAAPSAPAESVQTAPEPLAQGRVACHRVCIKGADVTGQPWRDGDIPSIELQFWKQAGHDYYIERAYASPQLAPSPPQPSASVGERARELLAQVYDQAGDSHSAAYIRNGGNGTRTNGDVHIRMALRALSRVLATEEDASSAEESDLLAIIAEAIRNAERHPRQQYGLNLSTLRAIESALTTAAAGGGLRELVERWRAEANAGYLTGDELIDCATTNRQSVFFQCANEAEGLYGR